MTFPHEPLATLLREPLRNGKSGRTSASDNGVRVFTLTAVTRNDFSESNTKIAALEEDEVDGLWAEPDDIFVQRSNTPELVGTAARYPGPSRFAVYPDLLIRVRVGERITPRFLAYYLTAEEARRHFTSRARGIAGSMPKIGQEVIEALPVPVPPLSAQEAIVGALDAHFSRLDAAVASLTRAKANVANARASVLKAAVEGRLATPAGSTSAESWRRATIGDAAEVTGGLTKNSKRESLPGRLPYLRVANVYANELRLTEVETIGVGQAELPRVLLQPGDVLIVEGNGSADQLGRVAVWTGAIDPCVHQNHLIKARPRPGTNSRWLLYWMMSPPGRTAIQAVASSTSGLHTLSISKVQALPVPLPPLALQTEIVAELDRRMSVLDRVEREVDAALARCKRVRQAILKHAFGGRLVPAEHPVARAAPQRATPAETAR